jgi:NAD(P)H-hydrate epimerase
VHGGTGAILGAAPFARCTVTFCRLKPGHLLLPARLRMGEVALADIGIPNEVVRAHDEGLRANAPALWRRHLRFRGPEDHKYTFGHAVVVGGPAAAAGSASAPAMIVAASSFFTGSLLWLSPRMLPALRNAPVTGA